MRFEQARDVLEHARDFHDRVYAFYRRLEAQADKARVRMLLDYLSDREQHLAESLDEFLSDSSTQVLNTWFQYTHNDKSLPPCPEAEVRHDMSVEDVIDLARRVHDCLVSLYAEIAASAESEEVRAVFQNLHDRSEAEWKQCCRDAQMLMDL